MIERTEREGVVVLRMAHGKANALDVDLCRDLGVAFDAAQEARGVVLTGTGAIFSAGVDLVKLSEGGPGYLRDFLPALSAALRRLFTFPRPVVAAVNGHAIAGGCIVAAACDHRVMARGEGKMGVTEVLVGVAFPTLAMELIRARLPHAQFQEAVLTGRTYGAEAAHARGFVDELVDPSALVDRACGVAAQMGAIPAGAFALTKRQIARPVLDAVERAEAVFEAEVQKLWESPGALDGVRAYVARTLRR